ncbi:sec1 family domain-containing protein 2-like isoform X2 [Acanthaster planci]|uniref:Sec1 family domain-containing protein 2-like isoform X2 n=1 Tax=Acanthaster planci TaxID=133434 RepID=A0A8B7XWC0_ACAPL|nr:sec1 family domain-containing protein 2-like isoform X2 [Acanthaster planci]
MATSRSIVASCRAGWETVCHHVSKAVVFVDSPMAECLHWCIGAGMLLRAGAIDIKEFSSFESATPEERKAVFIVSGLLADTVEEIIKDIVQASDFQYCIAVTAMPHSLHSHLLGEGHSDSTTESALFVQFENKLRKWMGGPIAEAEVVHVPLFAAPLCPSLFVVPTYSSLFPLLTSDLAKVQDTRDSKGDKPLDKLDDIELQLLPTALQAQLKMLVSGISSFCEQIKVNEDVYSIGHTSRLVAAELAGLPSAKARRKAAQHRASVLLIDRTLDLAGAASHLGRETLADRVLCHLDRLPGHSTDVGVDMADLFSLGGVQPVSSQVIYPGCLAHPSDSTSHSPLNTLITTKQKSLMDVNRQLVDAISKEKLPLKIGGKIGRVGPETLQTHLQLFKNNPDALRRNLGLLQVVSACVETLTHPCQAEWEGHLGAEKLLLQGMGEEAGAPSLDQILTVLEKGQTEKMAHSLDTILLLLVFAYSLAGDDSISFDSDERSLKTLLVQAILSEQEPSELITQFVGETRSEDRVREAVNNLFTKLRAVGRARGHLQQFRSIFDHGSMVAPASYNPFFKQVLDGIFSPNKSELPDIEYKSTGLRDLIKTGFRFFVNVSKPRPSDHPLLIVFVLGGVTCSEVRTIKETVASHSPNTQVVVGSTRILKPTDVLRLLLCQDNLHPTM